MLQEVSFGSLEKDESSQHLFSDARREFEFPPESIEFPILVVGEDQFTEWLVIAEKAFDQVESCRQASIPIDEVEPVRKLSAEGNTRGLNHFCHGVFRINQQMIGFRCRGGLRIGVLFKQ